MTSVLGLLVGVVLGAWSVRSLRRQIHLLPRHSPAALSPLPFGWLFRLAVAAITMAVLVGWSPVAALAALVGYWISRTLYLVGAHDFV